MGKVLVKRVYEPAAKADGFRVLVDRLWPRGLSKEDAHIDLWLRDIGPSTALRKWFNHDPGRWSEFQHRYHAELKKKTALISTIKARAKTDPVTLLYSAKDEQHNQAVALQSYLVKQIASRKPASRRKKTIPTIEKKKTDKS
ncbi:DUF488 domain-containing protein [Candidatus Nitrospira nitrificans]|uniref:Uroporphyrin-III C-methyltransferase n=1 Tax=Candidatus Nitrospira nitrificans TaxID=1742973 RepID=A0A0S4LFD1_9BACT|nr:DUF488 domain-containing protein [Candidatus Nitrospira nitrificans]CUS34662.1 conserved hypothetical protein [Candidatus Nitrospira nitrificans]